MIVGEEEAYRQSEDRHLTLASDIQNILYL